MSSQISIAKAHFNHVQSTVAQFISFLVTVANFRGGIAGTAYAVLGLRNYRLASLNANFLSLI